jgi:hypothetical protein
MINDQIKYLQSDEYKKKYEDLLKHCAEFMQEFAPPSPYELGFKAGWEAAKQEFHKDNTYVPDTTKPAKTMDLQWPRDQQAWLAKLAQAWPVPRTTTPWPQPMYQACGVCGIGGDINKTMSFVCTNPQCPTRVTCFSNTGLTT